MEKMAHYEAGSQAAGQKPKVSPKYTRAFMQAAYSGSRTDYRGYTLKRVKKEIRLLKSSRKLAAWDMEKNQTRLFVNHISEAEKRMAKTFCQLPLAAEAVYQEAVKESKQPQKLKCEDEAKEYLHKLCAGLADSEVNSTNLEKIIKQAAEKYVHAWHDTGNPDHFTDHYGNYIDMAKSTVRCLLYEVAGTRIEKLTLTRTEPISPDNYNDHQLLNSDENNPH